MHCCRQVLALRLCCPQNVHLLSGIPGVTYRRRTGGASLSQGHQRSPTVEGVSNRVRGMASTQTGNGLQLHNSLILHSDHCCDVSCTVPGDEARAVRILAHACACCASDSLETNHPRADCLCLDVSRYAQVMLLEMLSSADVEENGSAPDLKRLGCHWVPMAVFAALLQAQALGPLTVCSFRTLPSCIQVTRPNAWWPSLPCILPLASCLGSCRAHHHVCDAGGASTNL